MIKLMTNYKKKNENEKLKNERKSDENFSFCIKKKNERKSERNKR